MDVVKSPLAFSWLAICNSYMERCSGGREIHLWRCSCSSFMRAKLVSSFKVLGLNIRIASEISDRNPPMNDPTSAFVTIHEPDYPTSQTLFSNHEGIRFDELWRELHRNLHTLLVQNEPIVPPQITPKLPLDLPPGKHDAAIATID